LEQQPPRRAGWGRLTGTLPHAQGATALLTARAWMSASPPSPALPPWWSASWLARGTTPSAGAALLGTPSLNACKPAAHSARLPSASATSYWRAVRAMP
jgi:hypothetical protein